MRLIDADKLKESISRYAGMFDDDGEFWVSLKAVLSGIDFAKTVDAVPVVRCKDCKIWYNGWCRLNATVMEENEFCSCGTRKTNE